MSQVIAAALTPEEAAALEHALSFHEQGRLDEAAEIYQALLTRHPAQADCLHLLGLIAYQKGDPGRGAELIQQAIAIAPDKAPFHNTMGNICRALGQLDEAARYFARALTLRPQSAQIASNLGNALRDLNRLPEALDQYRLAVQLDPALADAHYNLANALAESGSIEAAVNAFQAALRLKPAYPDALYNLGHTLLLAGRLDEAETAFRRTLALVPTHAAALNNLGITHQQANRPDAAKQCFEQAIQFQPDYAEAFYNLGALLMADNQNTAAAECYQQALRLKPSYGAAQLALCMAALPILYQSEGQIPLSRALYRKRLEELATYPPEMLGAAVGTSQPFFLAYQGEDDRALQQRYGKIVTEAVARIHGCAPLAESPENDEKIRLGIVSGFFNDHTVWKLFIEGWLLGLDRNLFEIRGFHTGTKHDQITAEAARHCPLIKGPATRAQWRDEVASFRPHALLYPEIGMDPLSTFLAAQRLARLQAVSWGHPETTGLPTIDAFLSGALMDPPDHQQFYTETLIRLPDIGCSYRPSNLSIERRGRGAFGLRETAVIYWSGQALYKYRPRDDAVFPEIARRVPDCQFIFIDFTKSAVVTAQFRQRLERAFATHNLDFTRYCVFLPALDQHDFLAAASEADIVLDTLGWSGGKSTLDLLDTDPVLITCRGRFMRERHTAAILARMGLPELVTSSVATYIDLAVALGQDSDRRTELRAQIRRRKHNVYQDGAYLRALEDFLTRGVRSE